MSNIFDFDAAAADGWAAFRDQLTTQLTGLRASDSVRVSAPSAALDGRGPAALFTVTEDNQVRCVLGPTLLGQYRDIDDAELSLLMELEWDSICEDECIAERGRDEVEPVVNAATVEETPPAPARRLLLLSLRSSPPVTHTCETWRTKLSSARPAPCRTRGRAVTSRSQSTTRPPGLCVDSDDTVVEMFTDLTVVVQDSASASAVLRSMLNE